MDWSSIVKRNGSIAKKLTDFFILVLWVITLAELMLFSLFDILH